MTILALPMHLYGILNFRQCALRRSDPEGSLRSSLLPEGAAQKWLFRKMQLLCAWLSIFPQGIVRRLTPYRECVA